MLARARKRGKQAPVALEVICSEFLETAKERTEGKQKTVLPSPC